jgi:hypothetical protein
VRTIKSACDQLSQCLIIVSTAWPTNSAVRLCVSSIGKRRNFGDALGIPNATARANGHVQSKNIL